MIVKDEEKGLERAILSCKDFVDQILISVDSASTDKTLEIAQKYANFVTTHQWENDFAKTRNDLQEHVKTKWSLMLDGHEYVREYSNLEKALERDVEGLYVKIEMDDGFTFFYPRIYKSSVRYKMAVHNYPDCKTTHPFPDFVIVHDRLHLQDEEAIKERAEQRKEMVFSILQENLKKNKKDSRSLFYLAQQYRLTSNWRDAEKCYRRYLKYSDKKEERWLACYYLGMCYSLMNKLKHAVKFFKLADKELPGRWEIQKKIGSILMMLGKFKEAANYLVESLGEPKQLYMFNPEPRNISQTWFFISQCFYALKKYEEAKVALRQALASQGTTGWT